VANQKAWGIAGMVRASVSWVNQDQTEQVKDNIPKQRDGGGMTRVPDTFDLNDPKNVQRNQ